MDTILQYITPIDAKILLFIQDHLRFEVLDPFMTHVTLLGNMGILWILVSLVLLAVPKTRKAGFLALASMIVTFIIANLWLKNSVARVRPYETVPGLHLMIAKENDWSFPSGHASSAFAAATAIYRNCRYRIIGVPCIVMALIISWSRLYVGVHYPSDVICGALIGVIVAWILTALFRGKSRRKKRQAAGRYR